MAKTDFKTVDEYIQTFPQNVQAILQQVRETIQKAVPEAEETNSYQIPAFKYHGWKSLDRLGQTLSELKGA